MKYKVILIVFFLGSLMTSYAQYDYPERMESKFINEQFDSVIFLGRLVLKYLEDPSTDYHGRKFLINSERQFHAIQIIGESWERLNQSDSAIQIYSILIRDGSPNALVDCKLHYYMAKIKLKRGNKSAACDDLRIATRYVLQSEIYSEVVKLKDSVCGEYFKQKEIIEGKKLNPYYGNQIKLLSLFGMYENEVSQFLNKPVGKTFEHRGRNDYDCFIYKTKNGEYRIGYENGKAIVIFMYPSVKQKFGEKHLKYGGMFDTRFHHDGICSGSTSQGRIGNMSYYTDEYECTDGTYSMTYYGTEGGFVTKIAVY